MKKPLVTTALLLSVLFLPFSLPRTTARADTEVKNENNVTGQIVTPATAHMETIWNPLSQAENYLTSYYIKAGDETVFHATVHNYADKPSPEVIITTELYNDLHERVAYIPFYKFTFRPYEQIPFEMISSRSLPAGHYYYALGIYSADALDLIAWYPGYQSFTVHN